MFVFPNEKKTQREKHIRRINQSRFYPKNFKFAIATAINGTISQSHKNLLQYVNFLSLCFFFYHTYMYCYRCRQSNTLNLLFCFSLIFSFLNAIYINMIYSFSAYKCVIRHFRCYIFLWHNY